MTGSRVRHTVLFSLKHAKGSPAEQEFLADGQATLPLIAGVECFEALRQISPKNNYDFSFSMEFVDQAAYDRYSNDPMHNDFVSRRWVTEVSQFMEVDLLAIS